MIGNNSIKSRNIFPFAIAILVTLPAFAPLAWGQSQYPALRKRDFTLAAPQGFGDRQNSYPWSIQWFDSKLLVGTLRAEQCTQQWIHHLKDPSVPYPPPDPAISCTADPTDLALQAEIWSWDPTTDIWTRVYQSPNDVPIPNTSPQKYTAEEMGFRDMQIFTESDGTQALYVSGCSANEVYPGIPGAYLLRSTDGVNFAQVPHDPGTFLGDYSFSSFRGIQTYNNKFYVVTLFPFAILESANPQLGDNAFRVVTSSAFTPVEIASYNGFLYVATSDSTNGFSVLKTNAQGKPPYAYSSIITNDGYRNPYPNKTVVSMVPFNGSLYIGGDGVGPGPFQSQAAEVLRINPDDSWDVVVGQSRSTPVGQKNSLSGLRPGFGWGLNAHMWRMEIFDNRLYVGTFDESTSLRNGPSGSALQSQLGFDLWYTSDGTTFSRVDYLGFGDEFNSGVRALKATPYGLFLGAANPYYGLKMFQGISQGFVPPAAGGK